MILSTRWFVLYALPKHDFIIFILTLGFRIAISKYIYDVHIKKQFALMQCLYLSQFP